MIFRRYQSFGFVNSEQNPPDILMIYDLGVESRENKSGKERYYFNNRTRDPYPGYLIQYTLEGEGLFEWEDRSEQLTPGKAFFIRMPHDSAYFLSEKQTKPWKFFYIHFNGFIAEYFYNIIEKKKGPVWELIPHNPLEALFLNEYNSLLNGKTYKRYESGEFLYSVLTTILRELETPTGTIEDCVSKALVYMQKHCTQQMDLAGMCRELEVSQSHFSREFHARQGISPIQYLTNLRLEKAVNLLLNSSASVIQIAGQSGFSNGNYFSKVFRKVMGMSPGEYREINRGDKNGI